MRLLNTAVYVCVCVLYVCVCVSGPKGEMGVIGTPGTPGYQGSLGSPGSPGLRGETPSLVLSSVYLYSTRFRTVSITFLANPVVVLVESSGNHSGPLFVQLQFQNIGSIQSSTGT